MLLGCARCDWGKERRFWDASCRCFGLTEVTARLLMLLYAHFTAALLCFSGSSSVCGVEGSVSPLRFCQKQRPCGDGYCAAVLRVSMYSPLVQVAHEYDADCSLGRKICQLVTYLSRWPRVCQCPSDWRALFVFRASYLFVFFWCLLSFCSSLSLVWTCVGWVLAWCSAWYLYLSVVTCPCDS